MRPIISDVNAIKAPLSPPSMVEPRSQWHSPVPYLFGGLAALLGLVTLALLILACSYWRLSHRLDNNNNNNNNSYGADAERDAENGEKQGNDWNNQVKAYEEKILVIMAGEERPTFLATPAPTKASSFGDKNFKLEDEEGSEETESGEKAKQEVGDNPEQMPTITENSENHENQ